LGQKGEVFRNHLAGLPGVVMTSMHSGEPGYENIANAFGLKSKEMEAVVALNSYPADEHYLPLMGFRLLQGRNFDPDLKSDTAAVILTEGAVKLLGLKDPVGAELDYKIHVIGVVDDFHWQSLREQIAPSVFVMGRYFQLSFRVQNGAAAEVLESAQAEWKKINAEDPMSYHFMDENFGAMLDKEKVVGNAVGLFTALAIIISSMGLYGLAAYTTEQRNREIGIRKVMGANASQIAVMLGRSFLLLVATAAALATPISIYFMNKWEQGFAYRAGLEPWIFIAAILGALVIAIITVSFHSIRASVANPVETLKHE
jgi:putative ABC transport system permease protein